MVCSGVSSGVGIVVGLCSLAVVGSGIGSVQGEGDDWLGSGSGVVLVMSSAGQMVTADLLFTSTRSTKCGDIPPRNITGQACLGSFSEAGVIENTKRAIWVLDEARQI